MKLFKLAFVSFAVLSFVVACSNSPSSPTVDQRPNPTATPAAEASTPATTPDELADARATYKDSCARCHKDDGAGGTFEEQGLKPLKVPSLRSDHAVKRTDAQIAKQIQNGGDGMPAFKTKLDQQKIDALVRLIRHDFQGQAATPGGATPSPAPAR